MLVESCQSSGKWLRYIFGDALDVRPEERAAFLDEACSDAPELRERVETLLHEHDSMGGFLEPPLFAQPGLNISRTSATGPPAGLMLWAIRKYGAAWFWRYGNGVSGTR